MGARTSQSPATVPRSVGRYEIVRPIARGGMAEVFLARTRPVAGVERLFAIKCCYPHLRDDHEFASMFIEEARLAAQIRHPNVVATFDVGDDETLYLVMEYVEGEPLSELIKATRQGGGRLPLSVTLRIVTDALAGLHAAHETRGADGRPLGVVHRDVSPQNILVGVDGVARIVDFGIAKAEATATVTRAGQVKGKLAYLPPEQLTEHVMTRRGDVYAVGVVLWETLTCQRLFSGQNAGEIAMRVLEKVLDPPSVIAPEVPTALDAAVLKALLRDPEQRFATAADLALALEACGVPLASHRTVGEFVSAVHARRPQEQAVRIEEAAVADPAVATPATQRLSAQMPPGTLAKSREAISNVSAPSESDVLTQPTARRSRVPLLAASALVLVLLAGVVMLTGRTTPHNTEATPARATSGASVQKALPPSLPPARLVEMPGAAKDDAAPAAESLKPKPQPTPGARSHAKKKIVTPLARRRPALQRLRGAGVTPPVSARPVQPAAPPTPSEFRPGGV
ncbi:MAG: protein kinase [Deltaproteobacteria bacterium]|nr:protein kinase [Deltaproteobacteria bacterium]